MARKKKFDGLQKSDPKKTTAVRRKLISRIETVLLWVQKGIGKPEKSRAQNRAFQKSAKKEPAPAPTRSGWPAIEIQREGGEAGRCQKIGRPPPCAEKRKKKIPEVRTAEKGDPAFGTGCEGYLASPSTKRNSSAKKALDPWVGSREKVL